MLNPRPKFDSIARLTHLAAISEDKHAATRAIGDKMRDTGRDRDRTRSQAREIEQSPSFLRATNAKQLELLNARVARLEAAKAELDQRYQEVGSQRDAAARTYRRAKEYAQDHGLPVPLDLGNA